MSAPFGPGCPHYEALLEHGPANVKWCEERVCGWINEPSNTWSNLAYLAAGAWIIAESRRRGSRPGQAFGWAVVVMGALSFTYHATNNFLTQALDFLGMYLSLLFIVAVNMRRLGWPRRGLEALWLGACVAATLALWPMISSGVPIQLTVLGVGFLILGTELAARRRENATAPLTWFVAAALTLIVGESCSALDFKRVGCDPQSWLQGHAAWHVISAAAFPMLHRYYAGHFDRVWSRT